MMRRVPKSHDCKTRTWLMFQKCETCVGSRVRLFYSDLVGRLGDLRGSDAGRTQAKCICYYLKSCMIDFEG
jgi:hypothetical protein